MPWCPKCKMEYREGFTKCADCGEYLVDKLPEEEPEPASEPVTGRARGPGTGPRLAPSREPPPGHEQEP